MSLTPNTLNRQSLGKRRRLVDIAAFLARDRSAGHPTRIDIAPIRFRSPSEPQSTGVRQSSGKSVTVRKPPEMDWESFVERQIREAQEGGEFDNLPALGQPLADIDASDDEMW